MLSRRTLVAVLVGASLITSVAEAQTAPNQVLGTWRMVSAQIDPDGENQPAYGPRPNGLLVFTSDMHYIEVLTDSTIPPFASNERGRGTPEENARAMGSIAFFGTYTVDENGVFAGNRVDASTFPNWIGDVRTTEELQLVVDGDRGGSVRLHSVRAAAEWMSAWVMPPPGLASGG